MTKASDSRIQRRLARPPTGARERLRQHQSAAAVWPVRIRHMQETLILTSLTGEPIAHWSDLWDEYARRDDFDTVTTSTSTVYYSTHPAAPGDRPPIEGEFRRVPDDDDDAPTHSLRKIESTGFDDA